MSVLENNVFGVKKRTVSVLKEPSSLPHVGGLKRCLEIGWNSWNSWNCWNSWNLEKLKCWNSWKSWNISMSIEIVEIISSISALVEMWRIF